MNLKIIFSLWKWFWLGSNKEPSTTSKISLVHNLYIKPHFWAHLFDTCWLFSLNEQKEMVWSCLEAPSCALVVCCYEQFALDVCLWCVWVSESAFHFLIREQYSHFHLLMLPYWSPKQLYNEKREQSRLIWRPSTGCFLCRLPVFSIFTLNVETRQRALCMQSVNVKL